MSLGRDFETHRVRGSVNDTSTTSLVAAPSDSVLLAAQPQWIIDQIQLSTDASGNFTGVAIMDATSAGNALSPIWAMLASDYINTGPFLNARVGVGKPICLQRTMVGGVLYYDITYHREG